MTLGNSYLEMKKFFQSKKNLFIIISLLLVLGVGYFLFHNTKKVVVEEKVDFNTRNLSRVSFFHGKGFKCTMAIPGDWEGDYRMREKGNTVSFSFIIDPDNSPEIFSVRFYKESDQISEKEQEIMRLENNILVYELSTVNDLKIEKGEEFSRMKQDVPDITKTLKCSVE